jgi:FMN phosphatase YigB (HAD superfamily)
MSNRQKILAFDFDGVICDGVNECLLSVWNTWHGLKVDAFSEETLAEIPDSFATRFAELRKFVRHSGQFLVAFFSDHSTFDSREEFDAEYSRIPRARIERFLCEFEAYRMEVISKKNDTWVNMHVFYSGMANVLCRHLENVYVVSGKDAASIQSLLASKSIRLPGSRVFAAQKDKMPALHQICAMENVPQEDLIFCDDNFFNALEAHREGFSVLWADWGYQTPNDRMSCLAHNVPRVSLGQFLEMYSA